MQRQEKEENLPFSLTSAISSNDPVKLQKEISKRKYKRNPGLLNLSLSRISYEFASPLIYAVRCGYFESFKFFLELADTNVNIRSKYNWHLIHFLADELKSRPNRKETTLAMISLLLKDKRLLFDAGMTSNKVAQWAVIKLPESVRSKVLTYCFTLDITVHAPEKLAPTLQFNGDSAPLYSMLASDPEYPIDLELHMGNTLLMQCIVHGYTETALIILQRDPNINFVNAVGDTALTLAAKHGRTDVVNALLNRPDVNVHHQNKLGHTPITLAFVNNHPAIGVSMLQHVSFVPTYLYNNDTNLAMLGASCQSFELVEHLMKLNVLDVNAQDKDGNTALMHSVMVSDNAKIPNLLFRHGANPHITNKTEDYNVLMKAKQKDRKGLKPLLKEKMQEIPNKVVMPGTTFTPDKQLHDLVARIAPHNNNC